MKHGWGVLYQYIHPLSCAEHGFNLWDVKLLGFGELRYERLHRSHTEIKAGTGWSITVSLKAFGSNGFYKIILFAVCNQGAKYRGAKKKKLRNCVISTHFKYNKYQCTVISHYSASVMLFLFYHSVNGFRMSKMRLY